MKSLRFLPIAFVADVHGFIVFAPYMLVLMTAAYVLRRRGALQAVPIRS